MLDEGQEDVLGVEPLAHVLIASTLRVIAATPLPSIAPLVAALVEDLQMDCAAFTSPG